MRLQMLKIAGQDRYVVFESTAVSKLITQYGTPAEVVRLMCGVDKYIRQDVGAYKVSGNLILTTYDVLQREQSYRISNFLVANADVIIYAKPIAALGDVITIQFVAAGALAVNVVGNDITVDFIAGVDTANVVVAAINAHVGASALVFAAVAEGNDGTGLVIAWAQANLAGDDLLGSSIDELCHNLGERLYIYTRPYAAATAGSAYKTMVASIDPELAANLYARTDQPTGLTEPFRTFHFDLFVELGGLWVTWEDPRPSGPTWETRPA